MKTTRRTFLGGAAVASLPVTAIAQPATPSEISIDDFLANSSAAERAWYHVNALAAVMNEIHPGNYIARVDHSTRMAIVYDMNGGKAVRA